MISRILAAELPEHIGEHVTIAGWLQRRRELKSVTFLVIRDRTGLAQVVLSPDLPCPATEETVLQVEGVVVANAQAPGGAEGTEPVLTPLSACSNASTRSGRFSGRSRTTPRGTWPST